MCERPGRWARRIDSPKVRQDRSRFLADELFRRGHAYEFRIPRKTIEIKSARHALPCCEKSVPPVRTMGEVFPDGTGIDLLNDAATGRHTLLLFDQRNHTIVPASNSRQRLFACRNWSLPFYRAITLPSTYAASWIDARAFQRSSSAIRILRLHHGGGAPSRVLCFFELVSRLLAARAVPLCHGAATRSGPAIATPRVYGSPSRYALVKSLGQHSAASRSICTSPY